VTAQVLRERYARSFVQFSRYSSLIGWGLVAAYVVQIVGAIAFGAWLLSGTPGTLEAVAIPLAMLFIGSRLRGLNNIVHECSHASLVQDREDNARIGKFCASLTLGSFLTYRREHLSHHKHVGDYEHDLDLQGIERLGLHDPLTPAVVLRHLVTPLVLRHLPFYLSVDLSLTDGRLVQIFKLLLIGLVLVATITAPLTTILFVIFPYVVVFTALNYWADCLDHAGLFPSEDDLFASRNVLAPKWLAWLLFPRNDQYHLVHHLFPNVPARHLPNVHSSLLGDAVYRVADNAVSKGNVAPGQEEGVAAR